MLIVSELQSIGILGHIMHFAGSGNIGTILGQLTQSTDPGHVSLDVKTTGTFVFEWYPSGAEGVSDDDVFNRERKELVVQILASSFHKLEPITQCLHFTEKMLRSHVEALLRPDCPERAVAMCENLGYELVNQADFVAFAQGRGLSCDPSVGEVNCQYMVKRLSLTNELNATNNE
ncbi:unnamed protein product [Dibothriocephalus latus]|uniref:Uncharacterized protein n=1 Tax=Dibothriocephalus latus TaxID=60516 RepID=A0A3P7NH96_DIBLA|nr:unnamed protein product [Dibothriocephalus latus]